MLRLIPQDEATSGRGASVATMKGIVRTFLVHFLTTALRGLTPQQKQNRVHAFAGSAASYTSATGALTNAPPIEYKTAADYATVTEAASIEKHYSISGRLRYAFETFADTIGRLDNVRKALTLIRKILLSVLSASLTIVTGSHYDVNQEARHAISAVWGAIKKKYFS